MWIIFREQSATFVKRGSATDVGAYKATLVVVRYKTLFALNVREVFGTTEEGFLNARSASHSYVKMISLNIKRPARFWNPRISSVSFFFFVKIQWPSVVNFYLYTILYWVGKKHWHNISRPTTDTFFLI